MNQYDGIRMLAPRFARTARLGSAITLMTIAPQTFAADGVDTRSAGAMEIEEIVVTAQRREEYLQHTAIAVTALSGEELRNWGVSRPQELTHFDPALQVAATTAPFSVFYLRGVGNFNGNSLADAAVAFNFNDVFIGRPSSTAGFFYDLDRVEILKGPQGTLYGRNATGGAINVLPRRPDIGESNGEFAIDYGNYDSLRLDGAVNIPIGESAAARLAGNRVVRDGYVNDGTDDQDDWAGRLSLLFDVNAELSVTVVADYFDQGGHGPGSTPIALDPDHRFGVSSGRGGAFYTAQRNSIAGRNFNAIPGNQALNNQFWGVSSTIEWDVDVGTFTLVPGYRESHLDTIGTATGVTLSIAEDDKQSSLEARFASNADQRVSYIVGAYYFDETNDAERFVPNSQYNMSIQSPQSGVESAAVFGRLTLEVTRDFRATIGARYTQDDKFFKGSFEGFNRLCPPVPTAQCPNATRFPVDRLTAPLTFPSPTASNAVPVFNPLDGTLTVGFRVRSDEQKSFSRTTWRGALDWDVGEEHFLFASYETGFKSGGFFFSNDSQVFEPEELGAFTVGSKNRFLDNRVELNVEAFHWLYQDQQISSITLDSQGAQNLRTQNVGEVTIKGIEVDAQWLVASATRMSVDAQYLDATYDEFAFDRPLSSGPPVSGCAVTAGAGGFAVDCSGKRAPYAPEWTVNVGAEQSFELASGRLIAGARAHYQSQTLTGIDFTPHEYQDAYWSIDVSATFTGNDEKYYFTLFGINVTDETVVANTFQPPLGSFVIGTLRQPRLYGIRLGSRL